MKPHGSSTSEPAGNCKSLKVKLIGDDDVLMSTVWFGMGLGEMVGG